MIAKRIAFWIAATVVIMAIWGFFLPPQVVGTIGAGVAFGAWFDVKRYKEKLAQQHTTDRSQSNE